MPMIPSHIKHRICQHLIKIKAFEALEGLKRTSKEWCYLVLSLQWEEYNIEWGPKWFLFGDVIITDRFYSNVLTRARPKINEGFFEYGYKVVKKATFNSYRMVDDRMAITKCSNLKSLYVDFYDDSLDTLSRFVALNSTIVEISLSLRSLNFEFWSAQYLGHNLNKLSIRDQSIQITNLTFILDRYPNLKEFEARTCILDDVSDILVPNNTNNRLDELKQYPNITKFVFDDVRTPATNYKLSPLEQVSLGILRIFPSLKVLKINKRQFESENIRNEGFTELRKIEPPLLPLLWMKRLEIISISLDLLTNFRKNCPNVRELKLWGPDVTEKLDYYKVIQAVVNSFPQVERLEFDPGNIGHDIIYSSWDYTPDYDMCIYRLYDALFFHQSEQTKKKLIDEEWLVESDEVDLLFDRPIEFNLPNLKEMNIGYKYSPKVLLALGKFKNLEKLELGFTYQVDIDDFNETIGVLNASRNESGMFANVYQLRIGLDYYDDFGTEFIDLISLFPALKILYLFQMRDSSNYEKGMVLCRRINEIRPSLIVQCN